MVSHDDFVLHVTAGSKYGEHKDVPVNTDKAVKVSTELADVEIIVRIKGYRAPASALPGSSKYFEHSTRTSALYSLQFTVTPKKQLSADTLVLGNDFDKPIKQYLPPFFSTGLHVVKTVIDPGLDGDPYGEKPYLVGPLVSSVNVMRIGAKKGKDIDGTVVLEEGADGEDADKIRTEAKLPAKGSARQSYFLQKPHREEFKLEEERAYSFDFFNGYLDFNEFALKLPMGIKFNVLHQLGDEEIPPLRYILKDTKTDNLLFHVTFALSKSADSDEEEEEETANSDVD